MSEQKMKRQVQYGGPLSPSQGAAGIKAARENAQQLAREARLLFDAQAYARASSLALLAIEEVGKVPIIRRLVAAEEKELKPLWREFRSHTAKNFFTGYREAALTALKRGEPKVDDFDRLFRAEADEPHLYDVLKQLGFYADCVGECHWSRPAEVIEQDLAKHMVASAELMSGDGKAEAGIAVVQSAAIAPVYALGWCVDASERISPSGHVRSRGAHQRRPPHSLREEQFRDRRLVPRGRECRAIVLVLGGL